MQTNQRLFSERLAQACRARNTTPDRLCRSVGIGGRRLIDFELFGLKTIGIDRLIEMADRLDVSIDWLLGRTEMMNLADADAQHAA